ncbi:MAG TPA: hypothetical protein GX721_03345 [Firmicutes bacterium]|jgi:hypothetical protein|nr:hypothetical protein [Bacillota bacterium]
MSEEKKRILDLVRDGKVSVDEGLRLLEALDNSTQDGMSPSGRLGGSYGRMLRIRVLDTSDNTRVNVNIPLALAKVAMKFIPKDVSKQLEDEDIDLDQLLAAITESTAGKIVDVDSEDAKVKIYVE